MFRLEIFVDDRKLSYVLWALSGHVLEVKAPQPVANAQTKNGVVRARTSGNRTEMLKDYLREHKITAPTPGTIREFCASCGPSDKSYSNVLDNALKAKLLTRRRVKKGNSGFTYKVARGA